MRTDSAAPSLQSFHVTHKWADAHVVQAVAAIPAAELANNLYRVPNVEGCVALVTCHRSEVYLTSSNPDAIRDAVNAHFSSQRYRSSVASTTPSFRPRSPLRELTRQDTVRHLFRVASGLDSMILGETEVLGQVRSALRTAVDAGTVDRHLRRLFEAAIEVGRRARADTGIGGNHPSLGAAVWHVLGTQRADRSRSRVLVVGAGQAASSIVEAAPADRRSSLEVVNRNEARGRDLARRTGTLVRPFDRLPEAVRQADVCILAAPTPADLILSYPAANGGAARHDLLVLDVCQPPNMAEPSTTPGLEYWDLSAILRHGAGNDGANGSAVSAVSRIVEDAVARFEREQAEARSPAGRLLRLLHDQGERIARQELATAMRRLSPLGDRERTVLEEFARSIREKLLMGPTLALRRSLDADRPDLSREILRLFEVDEAAPEDVRRRRPE